MNRPEPRGLSIDLEPLVEQVVARLRSINGETKPAKRAFRAPEVAEMLSISEYEVRELMASGELESIHVGRIRLVPGSAIDRWIEQKVAERKADRAD